MYIIIVLKLCFTTTNNNVSYVVSRSGFIMMTTMMMARQQVVYRNIVFCLEKKYTPVNLLTGDAEKCYTRQKVFPVDDRTSGAFVTKGVYVYTTAFGVETGLLFSTLNLCTEPVIVPVGLISSS